MKEISISKLEEGIRFDRYLEKYLKNASTGFIYKMLRKKNITLNDKKADGKEKLKAGDCIKIFFKDETLEQFTGGSDAKQKAPAITKTFDLEVIYEDENYLFVNKPKGILSQKANNDDISMCEIIVDYLIDNGSIDAGKLNTFKPSVCNRLDRNTSGIIAAGKTMKGLQELSQVFKDRSIEKYYIAIVKGKFDKRTKVEGYLYKNEKTNKVTIHKAQVEGSEYILTEFIPVVATEKLSVLKVHLYTGKAHQIRAHLASIGFPIIGDYKYGVAGINNYYKKKYKLESQALHSFQLIYTDKGINICAPLPKEMCEILKHEGVVDIWEHGILEDFVDLR